MNRPDKPAPIKMKPRKLAPIPPALRRDITAFGTELCKRYGFQDRSIADQVSRMLRAYLTKRRPRGRPCAPAVLKAVELRGKDVPWHKVYGQAIPGYWKLTKRDQAYEAERLRRAVKARARRRRKRKLNS